jgi:energy-coupling factor transport system permease protein
MKMKLFSYHSADTAIHRMSGVTKLSCFLLLTFAVMLSYDIRVVLVVMAVSFMTLRLSKIRLSQIRTMLIYVGVFLLTNFIITYLFSPEQGVELYGTRTEIAKIAGRYTITREQILYQVTKLFKYCAAIPCGIVFILTTDPSEFASSLNAVGVHYKAAIAVSLTLRYFPDIQRNYHDISQSLQARGLEMTKKAKLADRFRNVLSILMPLIFSSLGNIDSIANAMDLRGFGKGKKRTWYSKRRLEKADYIALIVCLFIFLGSIALTVFVNKSRFYNPFL